MCQETYQSWRVMSKEHKFEWYNLQICFTDQKKHKIELEMLVTNARSRKGGYTNSYPITILENQIKIMLKLMHAINSLLRHTKR